MLWLVVMSAFFTGSTLGLLAGALLAGARRGDCLGRDEDEVAAVTDRRSEQ